MATNKYKPQRRRVGPIRYLEPNPAQAQGSYIYQFYRLNKKLIDAAYQGIGAASPYQHFKAEAIDLLTEQPQRSIKWATSYQLGKTSFVQAVGGNTYVNNILRMLRRAGAMQGLTHLAGFNKSSDIAIENFAAWQYDQASKSFTYTPFSNRTGKPIRTDRAKPVSVWITHTDKYPTGISVLHLRSDNGYLKYKFQGDMKK